MVSPHPEMAATAKFPANWMPALAVYYAIDCHFDLLVREDSRLALLPPRKEERMVEPQVKRVTPSDMQKLDGAREGAKGSNLV